MSNQQEVSLSTTQTCQVCGKELGPHTIWDRSCSDCSAQQKAFKSSAKAATISKLSGNESQGKGRPGVKDDGGKLMWNLLPWKALTGLVGVLTFGAKKYSSNGWRSVPNAKERYEAALLRHLCALHAGEKLDSESGLRHIDHLLCNAAFLAELED